MTEVLVATLEQKDDGGQELAVAEAPRGQETSRIALLVGPIVAGGCLNAAIGRPECTPQQGCLNATGDTPPC